MDNGDAQATTPSRVNVKDQSARRPAAPVETDQSAPAPVTARYHESLRPWASQRADGPSWADGVEQF